MRRTVATCALAFTRAASATSNRAPSAAMSATGPRGMHARSRAAVGRKRARAPCWCMSSTAAARAPRSGRRSSVPQSRALSTAWSRHGARGARAVCRVQAARRRAHARSPSTRSTAATCARTCTRHRRATRKRAPSAARSPSGRHGQRVRVPAPLACKPVGAPLPRGQTSTDHLAPRCARSRRATRTPARWTA